MKVTLYMAMTVNGYIATLEDEAPWSDEIWEAYYVFVKHRGATVVGRRTFEFMQEGNEFEKLGFPVTVVVSSQPGEADEHTTFVTTPQQALEYMQTKGVQEVVIGGGGKLNASFLEAGLLDEIVLDIEPVIFGQGIKLFDDVDATVQLELKQVEQLVKNFVRLHYRVKKV